jgi:hypothetical protein
MALPQHQFAEKRQALRLVGLLDSLARACIVPAALRVVHELAYLANVLAPVFELSPQSASLLKRRGGPYYPALQQTLDELVGSGVVLASNIRFALVPEESRYRLDAMYRLNPQFATPIIRRYRHVYADTRDLLFLDELVAAYSTLAEEQLGSATQHDARYAHSDVDINNVIDFGEWTETAVANFSRNAALSFRKDVGLEPAERLYLYLNHLKKKIAGAA